MTRPAPACLLPILGGVLAVVKVTNVRYHTGMPRIGGVVVRLLAGEDPAVPSVPDASAGRRADLARALAALQTAADDPTPCARCDHCLTFRRGRRGPVLVRCRYHLWTVPQATQEDLAAGKVQRWVAVCPRFATEAEAA